MECLHPKIKPMTSNMKQNVYTTKELLSFIYEQFFCLCRRNNGCNLLKWWNSRPQAPIFRECYARIKMKKKTLSLTEHRPNRHFANTIWQNYIRCYHLGNLSESLKWYWNWKVWVQGFPTPYRTHSYDI